MNSWRFNQPSRPETKSTPRNKGLFLRASENPYSRVSLSKAGYFQPLFRFGGTWPGGGLVDQTLSIQLSKTPRGVWIMPHPTWKICSNTWTCTCMVGWMTESLRFFGAAKVLCPWKSKPMKIIVCPGIVDLKALLKSWYFFRNSIYLMVFGLPGPTLIFFVCFWLLRWKVDNLWLQKFGIHL